MCFDDVVEMKKPDQNGQYRLKACKCGSEEVAYMHCRDIFGNLFWRVRCMECGAETIGMYAVQHDAQVGWNTRSNVLHPSDILYPGAGGA